MQVRLEYNVDWPIIGWKCLQAKFLILFNSRHNISKRNHLTALLTSKSHGVKLCLYQCNAIRCTDVRVTEDDEAMPSRNANELHSDQDTSVSIGAQDA